MLAKSCCFFLETIGRKVSPTSEHQERFRAKFLSPRKNGECKIYYSDWERDRTILSIFDKALAFHLDTPALVRRESLFRSFSLFLSLFTFLAPRAPLPYKLISRLAGTSAAGAEQLNSLFPFTYPFVSTFTFIFE